MLQIKNTLGGGGGNAPYAWAKYEKVVITNPTFTFNCPSRSNTLTITASSFDLSLITSSNYIEFFNTFADSSGSKSFDIRNGDLYFYDSKINGYSNGSFTWNTTFNTSYTLEMSRPTDYIVNNSFIEYVTDKSPTKYPNGEVHTDGYFYRYAPEGLYVWKKNEYTPEQILEKVNITLNYVEFSTTSPASGARYSITSDDFDVNLINDVSFFYGFAFDFGSYGTGILGDNGIITFSNTSESSQTCYWIADSKQFVIGNRNMSGNHTASKSNATISEASIGDFIDYIVSDKETAYPDGGEKGGYWYERVRVIDLKKLGCTKFVEGSFTPSSDTYVYNATHSLGVIPKFAIVYGGIISGTYVNWEVFPITTAGSAYGVCVNSGGNGCNYSSYMATFTSSKAEFQVNANGKLKSGIEYHYLLLA